MTNKANLETFIGILATLLWNEKKVLGFTIFKSDHHPNNVNVITVYFEVNKVYTYKFSDLEAEMAKYESRYAQIILDSIMEAYNKPKKEGVRE